MPCHAMPTFLDSSKSQVVDGSQQGPEAQGFLLRDAQDLQAVLDEVPHIASTLLSLGLQACITGSQSHTLGSTNHQELIIEGCRGL